MGDSVKKYEENMSSREISNAKSGTPTNSSDKCI